MAESVTIARPYAEAAFRAAQEAGVLGNWSERLVRLAAVARNDEVAATIGNPRLSAEQVAQFFIAVAEDNDPVLGNFIRTLAENRRLALLPEISRLFDLAKRQAEGTREARISTAFPIDEAQTKALLQQLEDHFGSRLTAQVAVNPELIGGIRVAVGDQVLDASVRGKLDAMAIALNH